MKKILVLFLFAFIIEGCSSVDWKSENSVIDWLDGKTLKITGDLEFHKNGSFDFTPYNVNDPTQHYTGSWSLGKFHTYSDGSGELRDLTLNFNSHGWVTDDYTDATTGQRFAGFGNIISGFLHKVNEKYIFTVEEVLQKDHMYIDMNSGEHLTGSNSTDYEFK